MDRLFNEFGWLIILAITSPITIPLFSFSKNRFTAFIAYRGWQAVFLANGQVYFGKIKSINSTDIKLTNIYYLMSDEAIMPNIDKKASEIVLTKLGSELHGPKDTMIINRQHIIFWENLQDDGEVVIAIKEYK